MNTEKAVEILSEALNKIDNLRSKATYSAEHIEFVQSTGLELGRIFGPDSPVTRNFSSIQYYFTGTFLFDPWDYESVRERNNVAAYLHGLDMAEGILRSAIDQLQKHGDDQILFQSRIKLGGAKVFVSHSSQTQALIKVERFIRVLGLEPVSVVKGPSEGMAVDDLVEKRMDECDCALILATADEHVDNRRQPRPNVIHEIGLAQEKFDNKVIYLKEVGCEFPSNVRPKVWENFTQDNMETAFEKISKELHTFGYICSLEPSDADDCNSRGITIRWSGPGLNVRIH